MLHMFGQVDMHALCLADTPISIEKIGIRWGEKKQWHSFSADLPSADLLRRLELHTLQRWEQELKG